jgi:hypothetical protein
MESKTKLVWFIDCSGMKDYEINAKLKQLMNYTNANRFFSTFQLLIIPAKENKFQILDSDIEINKDPKELENWLESIKNKLKNCLTVYLK